MTARVMDREAGERAEVRECPVALVCMPFSMADRPSIQLGLLAALLERAGFLADTYHLNLELAARIPDAYDGLCSHHGRMTGEWLFAPAAFGDRVNAADDAYYRDFPEELEWAAKGGKDRRFLSTLRHELLPRFIDDCLDVVDWGRYRVVGFSSTFQQNVASIALASRMKRRHPWIRIVFGGANMEDEMGREYARAFPCIDHVVVGEGDVVFPELVRRIAGDRPLDGLAGVTYWAGEGLVVAGQAPPVRDLDALPTPKYDEYFERHRRLGLTYRKEAIFAIPFESSRGCWWGEKHHCTFCGLNGLGMGFRTKSPPRVLSELTELALKHRVTMFQATDNIVDMRYVAGLFGEIEAAKTDYRFFYETKANLTPEQIRTMRRGGVRWLQPGIESLSTHVLRLMRKGCTTLQNVRLLKWCLYHRVRVGWNLLWGFPGEREENYRDEYRVLKLIPHLEPPNACSRIWIERFSPVFNDRAAFPARTLQPEPSYRYVYPDDVDLTKVAYFFDGALDDTLPDEVHQPTVDLVRRWKAEWHSDAPPTLFYRRIRDAVLIDDERDRESKGTHVFHGPMAAMYELGTATMCTVAAVTEHLREAGHAYGEDEVRWGLDEFCRRGLMIAEDGRYLSLAVPANPNW